jgi:hypothetical protein
MREMEWPPARGGAELLIDRQRLTARRLGGLGQTLISGDLDAAIAELAPGAPMLGLYALAPESAHALRIGRMSALLITPGPLIGRSEERPSFDGYASTAGKTAGARPALTTAGRSSTSRARTRARRSCRPPRRTSPRVRPRPLFLSSACADCSRGRPAASACISRRPGWRPCSPGSTGCEWSPTGDPHLRRPAISLNHGPT